MVTIAFTAHLRPHAPAPKQLQAGTAREALEQVFTDHPALRGYVLDEHGALRKHVALFIDGALRRDALDAPLPATASIYLMQALSGG
ncbi:MoaD/ThiS family protein [Chitinimonas arctica]|uniref:MoaD/ThiS family protein n=1 Tax=Chitinimonas arctica TaxID=2594795 RepID=A0A516SH22_9NEIS|nr:MoaD/ThiS family protein [Chitinimonas arctica]QDQ27410.1 MoaD/ThiS family protein [Chitinimonas arctica]